MPIVYLIQPCELIGTDRYKIGRSSKNDLSRMKGYKNGTRYISIMEVENDKHVERNLINHFNNTYKKKSVKKSTKKSLRKKSKRKSRRKK